MVLPYHPPQTPAGSREQLSPHLLHQQATEKYSNNNLFLSEKLYYTIKNLFKTSFECWYLLFPIINLNNH
jgi:hypothetical protein